MGKRSYEVKGRDTCIHCEKKGAPYELQACKCNQGYNKGKVPIHYDLKSKA